MITLIHALTVIFIAIAAITAIVRMIRGPLQLDRVLALDFMSIVGLSAISIFFAFTGEPMVLDTGLLLALIGFLTALVLGRYLEKRKLR